jgi:hypothetical protein
MKKSLILLFGIILLSGLVLAQNYKMEISTAKDTFGAGENITFKVTLYDENNQLLNDNVNVVLEDAEKSVKVEKIISSNQFVGVSLNGASYGQGTITAEYKGVDATGNFVIDVNELAKFEIDGEKLIITNIGNIQYTKTVQITIGDVTGTKVPKLDSGKKASYRLIAPEGVYNIKITDGKTTLIKNDIQLSGTGEVIGVLDEAAAQRTGITSGISPDKESETGLLEYVKTGKFVYVFILVIFGTTILLTIERRYRKKAGE